MFTMSVADMLDEYFEHDAIKGSIASTGVVGVWAGPNTPGTAYNLLHHALGELNGIKGAWGHVMGGMGAISEAIAASARASGAEIRTDAEVASIDIEGERVVGVTLASGEVLRAPIVASGAHPKNTILDMAGAENFSDEIVEDMRRFRTRGGSVKINMILKEPPKYVGVDAEMQETLRHTGVNLCPSIDYLERAWQEAQAGKPAAEPVRRGGAALGDRLEPHRRRHLGDDDVHPVRAAGRGGLAGGRAGEIRRRLRRAPGQIRAEHPRRDPRARGPRAAGHRAHLRPHRRLDLPGRAGDGPDGVHAPLPLPRRATRRRSHGLYLCGAGTHPGGGVMAASGHNAAKRILKDGRLNRLRRRATASTTR